MKSASSDIVYITGNRASGKSVLGYLLDGHPCTSVTHFHDVLLSIFDRVNTVDELLMKSKDHLPDKRNLHIPSFRNSLPNSYYALQSISEDMESEAIASRNDQHSFAREFDFYEFERELFANFRRVQIQEPEDIIKLICHTYFESANYYDYDDSKNKYFVCRGSANSNRWQFFLNKFENPKMININRDPRGIAATEETLENREAIKRGRVFECKSVNNEARRLADEHDNFILIEFEDLILSTESVIDEVCTFLNIEKNNILFEPTLGGKPIQTESPILGEINDKYTDISDSESQRLLNLQHKGLLNRQLKRYTRDEIRTYLLSYLAWRHRNDIKPTLKYLYNNINVI